MDGDRARDLARRRPPPRGKKIYEQYLDQEDGYRLTMQTIDDLSDENEPDEEAELEDSLDAAFPSANEAVEP